MWKIRLLYKLIAFIFLLLSLFCLFSLKIINGFIFFLLSIITIKIMKTHIKLKIEKMEQENHDNLEKIANNKNL